MLRWLFWGVLAASSAAYQLHRSRQKSQDGEEILVQKRDDLARGFDVSRQTASDGTTVIRFRGSYQDIMQSLNPKPVEEAPPLPEGLDPSTLPKYSCGCPHCGKMSLYGESLWHYHELSRTRGHYDNTTTFLARCKRCQGLMRATVDHDD